MYLSMDGGEGQFDTTLNLQFNQNVKSEKKYYRGVKRQKYIVNNR